MTVEKAVGSPSNVIMFDRPVPRALASYQRELARQWRQLREARAQAEALLRQRDELMQIQEVLRKLLALREDAASRIASLTPRQREIMELVLAGRLSKNIAWDLGISQRTVENHRAAIMKKTGTKSLAALARLALAAALNGADKPLVQPLARLALAAAWNGASEPPFQPGPLVTAARSISSR